MLVAANYEVHVRCHGAFKNAIVWLVIKNRQFVLRSHDRGRARDHFQSGAYVILDLTELRAQNTRRFGEDGNRGVKVHGSSLGGEKRLFAATAGKNERRYKNVGIEDHFHRGYRPS